MKLTWYSGTGRPQEHLVTTTNSEHREYTSKTLQWMVSTGLWREQDTICFSAYIRVIPQKRSRYGTETRMRVLLDFWSKKRFPFASRYILTRIAWVSHHHRIFLFPIPHIFRKDPIRPRTPCYQRKQREGEKVVTESRLIGRRRRPTWVRYREQPRIPNPTQKLTVSNLRTAELQEKRQTTEG